MLMIVLLDGSGFNLNAHRSETEQNGAAAQSLVLIHIVHSGFEPFISRFPTVKYFIIANSWSVTTTSIMQMLGSYTTAFLSCEYVGLSLTTAIQ